MRRFPGDVTCKYTRSPLVRLIAFFRDVVGVCLASSRCLVINKNNFPFVHFL